MSFLKRIITAIPAQSIDLKKVFNKKPGRQKLIDAGLILIISFMIVIYKTYKANPHF
jgi:hypothetical protein